MELWLVILSFYFDVFLLFGSFLPMSFYASIFTLTSYSFVQAMQPSLWQLRAVLHPVDMSSVVHPYRIMPRFLPFSLPVCVCSEASDFLSRSF